MRLHGNEVIVTSENIESLREEASRRDTLFGKGYVDALAVQVERQGYSEATTQEVE